MKINLFSIYVALSWGWLSYCIMSESDQVYAFIKAMCGIMVANQLLKIAIAIFVKKQ